MKRYLLAAAALLSYSTAASSQTTIEGVASIVTLRTFDPGLVVYATPIPFGPFNLDLDPGTSAPSTFTTNILTIGTTERSVEMDDLYHFDIGLKFNFEDPLGTTGGPITGETFGYYRLFSSCGLIAGGCGRVEWDGPMTFNFGNGGSFSLALSDAYFHTPGSAQVSGTFTLLSSPGAVPEPSTWVMMLLGFGAVGSAMRKRRSPALASAV